MKHQFVTYIFHCLTFHFVSFFFLMYFYLLQCLTFVHPLIVSIVYEFNPLFSVDFIGGFDPFPLYHVNEKSSHLLLKPMYL